MTNWIDRTISYFSPQAGFKRARNRALLDAVNLSYEGAQGGRRGANWVATGASANVEVGSGLAALRGRSRELVRNNHYAARAKQLWRSKVVGMGIQPRTDDQRAMTAWNLAQRTLSADSPTLPHFGAIQSLVESTAWESGEVLIRRRFRRTQDGLPVPIQLQVLEPDYIDLSKTIRLDDGGWIMQGIEFDQIGQLRGYWLFGQHPGEILAVGNRGGLGLVSKFVPAEEVIHYFWMDRPGQVHGVPALASVMLAMRDLDDWKQAEQVRKKVESCLAAFVTSPEAETGGPVIGLTSIKSSGQIVESFEPGMVSRLKPGEDVKINAPTYAGGYGEYVRCSAMDISTGLSIPYCLLTGDYSQSNYSSSRVGLVAFIEDIEARQWNSLIPVVCQSVWDWVMQAAFMAGIVASAEIPVQWDPPALDLLDRETEAMADSLMAENGSMTWPQLVARQGRDPETQMQEIEKWKPRVDAAGIHFATRTTTTGGDTQNAKGKATNTTP